MDTLDRIKAQIGGHELLLYMKGRLDIHNSGFFQQVAHILNLCQAKYAYVNVLENPDIRQTLPQYAQWPTFPQLYLNGELLGGCDIVTEMYENGELLSALQQAEVTAEKVAFEEGE